MKNFKFNRVNKFLVSLSIVAIFGVAVSFAMSAPLWTCIIVPLVGAILLLVLDPCRFFDEDENTKAGEDKKKKSHPFTDGMMVTSLVILIMLGMVAVDSKHPFFFLMFAEYVVAIIAAAILYVLDQQKGE